MRRMLIVGIFVLAGLSASLVTHRLRTPAHEVPARTEGPAPLQANRHGPADTHGPSPVTRTGDILSTQQLPDLPADQLVLSLVPRARAGDAKAASQLYLVLSRCNRLAQDTSVGLRPQYVDPALLQRLGVSEAQLLAGLEWNTLVSESEELEGCQRIPGDQLRLASHWLEFAAREGDPYARLIYADSAQELIGGPTELLAAPGKVEKFRRDAMTYLHSVAVTGSAEAMIRLASAYSSGVLVDRDPVLAYAYEIAAASIAGSALPHSPLEAELSSQDLARARMLARELGQ